MDYAKEALRLHEQWKGKIEVQATVPVATKEDLSLAYTPGVAAPCLEIQKDVNKSYDLTRRHNLCAVITDGSAVLGLGDIGPEAGMPVMEGKCVLFKAFGDVDAFPLCVKTHDVDEFVNAVYLISGSFGGINLEDIAAPRCFEIDHGGRYGREHHDGGRRDEGSDRAGFAQRPEGGGQEEGGGKDCYLRCRCRCHRHCKAAAVRRIQERGDDGPLRCHLCRAGRAELD